jgi:hypothetical protein
MCLPITVSEARERLEALYKGLLTFPHLEEEFTNSRSNITVICPIHGSQMRLLNNVLNQQKGCMHCKNIRKTFQAYLGRKLTNNDMVELYTYIRDVEPVTVDDLNTSKKTTDFLKRFYRHKMNY